MGTSDHKPEAADAGVERVGRGAVESHDGVAGGARASAEDFRVLYVDDSATQLLAVRKKLQSAGFKVSTTSDLSTAAAQLGGKDLVLLDFHMPGTTGAEALAQLKGRCRDTGPLFYLYTSDRGVAASYGKYGFDGAFTQKGSVDELARQIANVAKLVRMKRGLHSSGTSRLGGSPCADPQEKSRPAR